MVKKLLKHELFALFRVLVFFAAAVLILAITGRILLAVVIAQSGEGQGFAELLMAAIILFYVFSIMALVVAAYALGASRFYKTLFTGEGYMTLSLPVSPVKLIAGKLLSALIALFAAAAVSGLSLTIFLVGWNAEVMQNIYGIFNMFGDLISQFAAGDPLSFAENIVQYVVAIPMVLLIIYAVISVGQTFTSHRKGYTFALLICVYFVWNILSTVLMIPLSALSQAVSPHLTNWITIVLYAGVDAGCFFLIKYMLKNKVNLIA